MENKSNSYFLKPCVHKPIVLPDGGVITGGTSAINITECSMLVLHAWAYMPDTVIIDSYGILSNRRRRVIFYPIEDRFAPKNPQSFNKLLKEIHRHLSKKKHVHIQCFGGHGRTGLTIACILGKFYGIKDPVRYVRENYCSKAVETFVQHKFISSITGCPPPNRKDYMDFLFNLDLFEFNKKTRWVDKLKWTEDVEGESNESPL